MRHWFTLAMIAAIALMNGIANAQSARPEYRSPTIVVPFSQKAPNIDGIINDAEWSHAFCTDALQNTEGALSARPTRFWLTWDADNLYVAMRSPLRENERPIQANRQTDRDNSKVVFDDSYEIWINANTVSPDGQKVFFQYLGNIAGAFYDVMFEPSVGNSRPGWHSNWRPANRVTPDGKAWEMEMAIPRKSLYRDQPLADGDELRALIVRNFKRPWTQNSIGGSGSFSAGDTHSKLILSKTAPAITLLNRVDAAAKKSSAVVSAISQNPTTLKWTWSPDGGTAKSGTLNETATEPAKSEPLTIDRPADGRTRLTVTSVDGKITYLDWATKRAFESIPAASETPKDNGTAASLSLTFNPVRDYVRVAGDFINFDRRDEIVRYRARVKDSAGKSLVDQDLKIDKLEYVQGVLQLGKCLPGDYETTLTCYDVKGGLVMEQRSPFSKKDPAKEFPWWNTTAGNIEKVIEPWTTVKLDNDTVSVWGRSMQIGAAGLPSQVTAAEKQLLAGPIELVVSKADGDPVKSTGGEQVVKSQAENRVVVSRGGTAGDLQLSSVVTTEFDGMYKVEMTILPNKPVDLSSLKIIIPMKPEQATYYHASGEGIRYGFGYGDLPADKRGRLWGSNQVDGQPILIGSFIPFVWLGNDKAGLSWYADSDEGWNPNNETPAIEIRRDSDQSVDLVLNLISAPTTLDKPRKLTFAFQATPVKPLHKRWRMDTWWTNDTFRDFCLVEPKGGHLIWNALPFTLDTAASKKMVEERHAADQSNFDLGAKYKANAVPYFENNGMDPKFVPEAGYFLDEWKTRVTDSMCFGKTQTDYIIYNLGKWCKETGIDGWYVDNIRPVACDNIDAGRGYLLPDGRIQPTYQIFDTRIHFLRARAVFLENDKRDKIVLHMTNNMVIPWIGAADLALDGEDHVIFPEMGKDFIDFWSLERLKLDYHQQWGVAVTYLQEYQGNWDSKQLHKVMRAYTGMMLINDVLPSGNPNGQNVECWRARDKFGIEADDVSFTPYWDKGIAVKSQTKDVYASLWQRPDKALIAVLNRGENAEAKLTIDTAKLGLGAPTACTVVDAETGETILLAADGALSLPVSRHDYRQLMVSTK